MFAQLAVVMNRKTTLAIPIAVFLLTLPALVTLKSHFAPHYSFSREQAVHLARVDPTISRTVDRARANRVRVLPLDPTQREVLFFRGAQIVAVAAVGRGGTSHVTTGSNRFVSGSKIANSIPVLTGMTLLFVLATTTLPLLSLRNLDVLALVLFVPSIVILDRGYLGASIMVAYPALIYLAGRCFWLGLSRRASDRRRSLFTRLTETWAPTTRARTMTYLTAGAAVMAALVTVTSTGASDVAFAALSGATDLLHGVLPYGHVASFIVHGDTYPPLTYAAYLPGAAIWPVTNLFSDPQGALLIAAAAMLGTAALVHRLGRPLAGRSEPGSTDARIASLRMTLAWLTFPPVLLAASGGSNDLVVALCVAVALVSFAHRGRPTLAIVAAAWVKVIPALSLPLFVVRGGRRGAGRAALGAVGLSVVVTGWMIALGGFGAVASMVKAMAFQVERGSPVSLWTALPLGFVQPAAAAMLVSCVVAATVACWKDLSLRSDLRRVAALVAGIMLIAQISASYWTWAYLPWVLVPLLASLLAPDPTTSSSGRMPAVGGESRSGDVALALPAPRSVNARASFAGN